jgi:hypothetical protein
MATVPRKSAVGFTGDGGSWHLCSAKIWLMAQGNSFLNVHTLAKPGLRISADFNRAVTIRVGEHNDLDRPPHADYWGLIKRFCFYPERRGRLEPGLNSRCETRADDAYSAESSFRFQPQSMAIRLAVAM